MQDEKAKAEASEMLVRFHATEARAEASVRAHAEAHESLKKTHAALQEGHESLADEHASLSEESQGR